MLALATNPKWVIFAQLHNKTEYKHTDTGNHTHKQHRIVPCPSVQASTPNSHSLALRMSPCFPANRSPSSRLEDDNVTVPVPVPVSVSRTTENASNPAARRDTALGYTSSTDARSANAPSPAPPEKSYGGYPARKLWRWAARYSALLVEGEKKVCVGLVNWESERLGVKIRNGRLTCSR